MLASNKTPSKKKNRSLHTIQQIKPNNLWVCFFYFNSKEYGNNCGSSTFIAGHTIYEWIGAFSSYTVFSCFKSLTKHFINWNIIPLIYALLFKKSNWNILLNQTEKENVVNSLCFSYSFFFALLIITDLNCCLPKLFLAF